MSVEREMQPIVFLDEDHVLRLAMNALKGPEGESEAWIRGFFAPEVVDPAEVYALGTLLRTSGASLVEPQQRGGDGAGQDASALVFRRGDVSAEVMSRYPRLRLVQRLGETSDCIDLAEARRRGIRVSCLPRRTLIYTGEHAILLMLALSKRLVEADRTVRAGDSDRVNSASSDGVAYNWVGLDRLSGLHGRTLGIIGLGEVGAIVASRARAFGMRVLYHKRSRLPVPREAELGVIYAGWADLLAQSDIVSVNAANIPENRGMMNHDVFAAMKPGALFVNTSRGRLVDEDALHQALRSGHLGGAGLDVHWDEPRKPNDRFAQLSNVILTPHCGGGSRRGLLSEIRELLENCWEAQTGGPLHHEVKAAELRPS